MSEREEVVTLEDQIHDVSETIEGLINNLVEKEGIDPTNNKLTNFEGCGAEAISEGIKLESSKNLIVELSSSRVLSNFISLGTSENDHNLKQIATLLDLSFHLKKLGECHYDLPHELIKVIVKESGLEWLLKFWSYFDLRIDEIKTTKENEVLQSIKFPGSSLIITLNLKIKELEYNNEPKRDILKSKILGLSSKIFPISDKYLINRSFDTNKERINEIRFKKAYRNNLFNSFWRLQGVFTDPIDKIDSTRSVSDVLTDAETVYNAIYDIETEVNGPLVSHKRHQPENTDNSIEKYTRQHLSETKREELKEFYSNREFSPSFFINEGKFNEQIKLDKNLRRTALLRLLILSSFFLNINEPEIMNDPKTPYKLKKLAKFVKPQATALKNIKRDIQIIFQGVNKRLFFTNQLWLVSDFTFLEQKLQSFKELYTNYGEFEVNDKFYEVFDKIGRFTKRFWAQYGTPQITAHWRKPIGIDLLKKDENTLEMDSNEELEKLRTTLKETDDEDVKNLLQWKALRLARKTRLFDFKHVNGDIGIEGLFDHSLKEAYEIKKKEEDVRLAKEEEERREELLKKREEEKLELERKRKASEEEFAEKSKRVKLESANSTKDSEALDY